TATPVTDAPKANVAPAQPEAETVAKTEDAQTPSTADPTPRALQPPQSKAPQETQQQSTVEDTTPQQNASTEVHPKNVGTASRKHQQTAPSTAPKPYTQQA
ncbi:hypothetical protein DV946_14670, partial [Staphylococcus pseudintermedius]|uniref:hypothetical protein n=1 Tax=Staphylococcus pseudintermedius TaxID=283734 RepID=UPI000E3A0553